jgi:hypothetical protein
LKQRREHLLLLKNRWINPMAHALRFDEHVRHAEMLARRLTGVEEPAEFLWLNTITVDIGADVGEAIESLDDYDNAEEAVMADLLADELEDDIDPVGQLQHQAIASHNPEPSSISDMEDHIDPESGFVDVDDSDIDMEVVEDAIVIDGSGPPQSAPVPTVIDWSDMVFFQSP